METVEEINIALRQVHDLYGEKIQDKGKTLSAFSDFAPKLKRERRIFEVFLSCGGHQILRSIVDLSDSGKITAINNLVTRMNDEGAIDVAQGIDFCNIYWGSVIQPGCKLPAIKKQEEIKKEFLQKQGNKEKSDEQISSSPKIFDNHPEIDSHPKPDTRYQQKKGKGLGKVVFALMCLITCGTIFYFVGMPMISDKEEYYEDEFDEDGYDDLGFSDRIEGTSEESFEQYSFYGVWCFASKEFDNADLFADSLIEKGLDAFVCLSTEWTNLNKDPWYIVSAGEYYTEEEAKEALRDIRSIVPDAYIGWTGYYVG